MLAHQQRIAIHPRYPLVRLLTTLVLIALAVAACSNADSAPAATSTAPPQATAETAVGRQDATESSADSVGRDLTINIELTDSGFQPETVFIPVDRGVQLIIRNRGATEHHYRVLGLVPRDLRWLVLGADPEPIDESDDDAVHESHHETSFMEFRPASPAGIRPLGDEVHAYAAARDVDRIIFVATNTGTFQVEDPLHPEFVGSIVVY